MTTNAAERMTIDQLLGEFSAAIRGDERIRSTEPSAYYNTTRTHGEALLESGERVAALRTLIGQRIRELERRDAIVTLLDDAKASAGRLAPSESDFARLVKLIINRLEGIAAR